MDEVARRILAAHGPAWSASLCFWMASSWFALGCWGSISGIFIWRRRGGRGILSVRGRHLSQMRKFARSLRLQLSAKSGISDEKKQKSINAWLKNGKSNERINRKLKSQYRTNIPQYMRFKSLEADGKMNKIKEAKQKANKLSKKANKLNKKQTG